MLRSKQGFHAVLFRESLHEAMFVFEYASEEIVRHADIERAPWAACHDVNEKNARDIHLLRPQRKMGHPDALLRAPGDDDGGG